MRSTKLFLISFLLLMNISAFADSPLTSTEFFKAYKDVSIIKIASKSGGTLKNVLCEYLINELNPIDVKIGVINQLGWNTQNRNNAGKFLIFLKNQKLFKKEKDLLQSKRSDIILCYSYLMAMDNYFSVDKAKEISKKAVSMNPLSYTYNIISALIVSQNYLKKDWGLIYESCDKVRKDTILIKDMRPESIKLIFAYIESYKKYQTNLKTH